MGRGGGGHFNFDMPKSKTNIGNFHYFSKNILQTSILLDIRYTLVKE
jgi:hypothetical protein